MAAVSGWASRREAMTNLKATIVMNAEAPSQDPRDYWIGTLFDALYHHRGRGYGWGATLPSYEEFIAACHDHLRPAARARIEREQDSEGRCP